MSGYGFFGVLRFIIFFGLIVVAGMSVLVGSLWHELSMESSYRHRFGEGWQAEYENDHGSLAQAHTRVGFAAAGIVIIPALLYWLYRGMRPDHLQGSTGSRRRSKPQRRISSEERFARYRRNAMVGIYFGLLGIVVGVLLTLFYFGLLDDPDNEQVVGLFVFLGGYCALVSGCWWWLKAKSWNEAVVLIALAPLIIFFIPFVRLILLACPPVLFVSMVMMPLILLVVVFVLPDHSPVPKKRRGWSWGRERQP